MPHSTFKENFLQPNSGVGKCSCGQIFIYASDRAFHIKLWLNRKVCPNLPEGRKHISIPKKAIMLKEVECDKA